MDPYFWGWSMWFVYNGLWPRKARHNHEAHRRMGHYSYQCQQRLEVGTSKLDIRIVHNIILIFNNDA